MALERNMPSSKQTPGVDKTKIIVWSTTLTNRHSNITLPFLPVGHTNFSRDWWFGLHKCQYQRTKVGSLQAIAEVVNKSAECNYTLLVSLESMDKNFAFDIPEDD